MSDNIKKRMQELIYDSAITAKKYEFDNGMPNSTNGVGLSKWLSKEIIEIDKCIDNLEERHGLKSVCKKGCAECCKQCIVVISSECPAIEAYINNMDINAKNALKIRTQELCRFLEEKGITNNRLNGYISETEERKLQEEYFKLGKTCVFLDENNACMIHPVRPSLCWSYREYFDSNVCRLSCFSDTAIKYDDWENRFNERLMKARRPHKQLMFLPFAIKEAMHW